MTDNIKKNILPKPLELCQNICLSNNCWYQKTNALALAFQKNLILGGTIWGLLGVVPTNYVKIFVLNIYWYQENWHPRLSHSKTLFLGGPCGMSPGVGSPPNYVKIFVCKISTVIKNHWHPKLSCWKINFWRVPGEEAPQNYVTMSKYLSVKDLLISTKTGSLVWAVPKIDFLGRFLGESPQNISGEKIAFAAQQLYAKIIFACFVV